MYRVIGFILLCIGVAAFIGTSNQFKLRNSNLKLHGADTDHQYIIDELTGKVLISQHIVDISRQGDSILILRVDATSYECGEDKLIFTHYDDVLTVSIFDMNKREIESFSTTAFIEWLSKNKIKNPFKFTGYYSNDEPFKKINDELGCKPL